MRKLQEWGSGGKQGTIQNHSTTGLNLNGMGGDKRCNYVVNIDRDGFVKSIVIMTERNCRIVLGWILKMVS